MHLIIQCLQFVCDLYIDLVGNTIAIQTPPPISIPANADFTNKFKVNHYP